MQNSTNMRILELTPVSLCADRRKHPAQYLTSLPI